MFLSHSTRFVTNCREQNSFCKTQKKKKRRKACERKDLWGYQTMLAHLLEYPYHSQSLFPGICTVNLIFLLSPCLPNPLLLSKSWNRRHRAEANAIMDIISCHSFSPHWVSWKICHLSLHALGFYSFTAQLPSIWGCWALLCCTLYHKIQEAHSEHCKRFFNYWEWYLEINDRLSIAKECLQKELGDVGKGIVGSS